MSVSGPSTRFLVRALALTGVGVLVAWLPVRLWIGAAPGAAAVLLAAAVALLGALAGFAPRLFIRRDRPDAPFLVAMAAIGTRMLTTAALVFVVLRLGLAPAMPFAVTCLALYLGLLVLEVREAVREVQQTDGAAAR